MNETKTLKMWVVTRNTKDFPGLYVVRVHEIGPGTTKPTDQYHAATTLEEIHKFIPADKVRIDRHPQDDPVIVESWV